MPSLSAELSFQLLYSLGNQNLCINKFKTLCPDEFSRVLGIQLYEIVLTCWMLNSEYVDLMKESKCPLA